jgi:phage minor structural protein
MIRLWESTEKNFKGNQWILNECTKCEITEIINGELALDLEYPLQDTKGISKYIVRGNIITCPVKDNRPEQQFRIRKVEKTSSKVVVYAEAKLIADLKANRVRKMTIAGKTRRQAIQYIFDNTLEKSTFVAGNLDANTNTNVIINIEEGSALEALIGKKNSILSEYGGEFIINNNTMDIVNSRGSNNGFTIAYGKNISSIKETIDDTDLVTVLIPKAGDIRLPEYCVESPKVNNYEKKYFKDVELKLKIWDGKGEKGSDEVTQAEAYQIIRTACNKMFVEEKLDQINFNYSVDLVALGKTKEYKEYAILESTNLGDLVEIKHEILNLDLSGRINKTIYNVLLDKYSKLEIGFAKQDIADIINTTVKQIDFAKQEISLKVENVQKTLSSEIKVTEESILQAVTKADNNLKSQIEIEAGKINAVVQSDSTGMGWTLNQKEFKVACIGVSDSSVTIDKDGLTVKDGKFKLKHKSNTVFKVDDKSGICTADGGFMVEDGDTSCEINSSGVTIRGTNGFPAQLQAMEDMTGLFVKDDLYVEDVIRVYGDGKFEKDLIMVNGGTIYVTENKTLKQYIDERIERSK